MKASHLRLETSHAIKRKKKLKKAKANLRVGRKRDKGTDYNNYQREPLQNIHSRDANSATL